MYINTLKNKGETNTENIYLPQKCDWSNGEWQSFFLSLSFYYLLSYGLKQY